MVCRPGATSYALEGANRVGIRSPDSVLPRVRGLDVRGDGQVHRHRLIPHGPHRVDFVGERHAQLSGAHLPDASAVGS